MTTDTQIRELVETFPATFERAVSDLARYKLAKSRGLVRPEDQATIESWFYDFPLLWQAIRPNWEEAIEGRPQSPENLAFANNVNRWIIRLRGDADIRQGGLGLVWLIIAGVAVVTALVGSLGYLINYRKRQDNIAALIDGALQGKLPPELVAKAIDADKSNFLGGISSVLQKAAIVGVIVLGAVLLLPMLRGRRA